jgi:hypothetical protein
MTELGAVPWAPVLGGTVLGAAAVVADGSVVRGGPGSALLWFGLAAIAAAAGFVLDEAAAPVVDAVPRSRWSRNGRRLLVAGLPLAAWWGAAAWAASRQPHLSWPALAVAGLGLVAATLGAAAAMRRAGHESPGEVVAAGAVAVVVLALAVGPVPGVGEVLAVSDVSSRTTVVWSGVAAAAAVLVVWGSADPLTRWRRRP